MNQECPEQLIESISKQASRKKSKGWFNSKNSKTFSLAFLTKGLLVNISLLFRHDFALIAHDTIGFGEFFNSTKHIRQFPAIDKRS